MSDKNNYTVCGVNDPSEGNLKVIKAGFASTREAERWVRDEAHDGLDYLIIKVTRKVRVETVTRRKLTSI